MNHLISYYKGSSTILIDLRDQQSLKLVEAKHLLLDLEIAVNDLELYEKFLAEQMQEITLKRIRDNKE